MYKTSGLKTSYKEVQPFDNHVRVNWNYEKIMVNDYKIDEEGNIIYDDEGRPTVIGQHEDPLYASWWSHLYDFTPSPEQIKDMILGQINDETDQKIMNGFSWTAPDGTVIPVYLSSENQFNYKAAYDLAVQTAGATLPFKLKFGPTDSPSYYDFTTVEDFGSFYGSCVTFINQTLQSGWAKKDAIDWSKYQV